jgi:hypothetical protein
VREDVRRVKETADGGVCEGKSERENCCRFCVFFFPPLLFPDGGKYDLSSFCLLRRETERQRESVCVRALLRLPACSMGHNAKMLAGGDDDGWVDG